jgi:hypothetical protein
MAEVRLGRYEAREGGLPPVCLRCARPASVMRTKVFVKRPGWLYLLVAVCWPALPVLFLVGDRVPVRAPLCELHKHHWLSRKLSILAAAAVVLVIAVAAVVLWINFRSGAHPLHKLSLILGVIGLVVGPPAVLGLALTLRYAGIYPTEITRHSITLAGVPNEFLEAVRVARRGGGSAVPHPSEK